MPCLRSGFVALLCLVAPPALANCNPPAPGLGPDQWYYICTNEIDYAYRRYGQGWDFESYVAALYQAYVRASLSYNSRGAQNSICSPDGQSYCNSSGWLMTCTNGQWLTGAVNCNQ